MCNNHLSNELPHFLENTVIEVPTLISWVTEINRPSIIADYQRTFSEYTEHMYWNKTVENFTLYGVDPVTDRYETILTNSKKIKGTGPIELSADLFDSSNSNNSQWESLGEPFCFVPSILLTEINEQCFLTLNFVVHQTDCLLICWQSIVKKWHFFLSISNQLNDKMGAITSINEVSVDEWMKSVNDTIEMLKESSIIKKVVMARQLVVNFEETINIPAILCNLKEQQPNTYQFVVRKKENYFIGASPERLLEATPTRFFTSCVAGSIRRGNNTHEDAKLGNELLQDKKNLIEHDYVVKWLTSEIKKITTHLNKTSEITLLKNRDIQHLYIPISGVRNPHIMFKKAISSLHPSPALGGIPKKESLEWIRTHELSSRGLYGGPLGWRNKEQDTGEMAVGIRSCFIKDKKAVLYAGCGIVVSSNAKKERQETAIKFKPMLRALGGL